MILNSKRFAASLLLAGLLPLQPVLAQSQAIMVPVGGATPPPVSQNPVDPKETPEDMAKDAAADLTPRGFYNKPGATRAQFDADWQRCRLIARGSRTPAGSVPMMYNPAVMSPLAAGIGAGIGGMIGAAIIEGQQRRANRRACLLIGGWRYVDLPQDQFARVYSMTDDQRAKFFNEMVGAKEVTGKITEHLPYSLPVDANLHPEKPLEAPGTLALGKKEDPANTFVLAPGEGAVVLAYRRVEPATVGRGATLQLWRYDPKAGDLIYQPRDWKKQGDKTTYSMVVSSLDRKSPYEVRVLHLTAGDYVIGSAGIGNMPSVVTNCFGSPTFHVGAGEIVYLGDFIPYWNAPLSTGAKLAALGYASHVEDARKVLAGRQAESAAALKPADLRNGATFACAGVQMWRWEIDGLPPVPPPAPVQTAAVAPAAS
jgi:hypothetical protein